MLGKVFKGLFGKGKARDTAQESTGSRASSSQAAAPAAPQKTAEELCGIDPGMPIEEIKEILASLYKRYNRAAASIDIEKQREADLMLDAIVDCRHKYLGE
jgi:hypothetical protein